MDWSNVKFKDLREVTEFDRNGHFKLIAKKGDNSIQIWERSDIQDCPTHRTIEVIKPVYVKRLDVLRYPSSEEFGKYGFSFPYTSENLRWATYILDKGFPSTSEYMPMYREWKKTGSVYIF